MKTLFCFFLLFGTWLNASELTKKVIDERVFYTVKAYKQMGFRFVDMTEECNNLSKALFRDYGEGGSSQEYYIKKRCLSDVNNIFLAK